MSFMTRNLKQIVFLFLKGNLYDSVNIEFNLSIFIKEWITLHFSLQDCRTYRPCLSM